MQTLCLHLCGKVYKSFNLKVERMSEQDEGKFDKIESMTVDALTMRQLLPTRIPTHSMERTYVGIDFGTSTTVVSIANKGEGDSITVETLKLPQLLEDGTRFESECIPSVIAYYQGQILVGEGASSLKYALKLGREIWYSFKMEMGIDLGARYFDSVLANDANFRIRNPQDAVRVFFWYLNTAIQKYCESHGLSTFIEYAISIPASFEANQRRELVAALDANGMRVSHQALIDEPNAAFISYIQESANGEKPLDISPSYNSKILVFDFGGGTCDISILEIGKSINGVYSKNLAISKFAQMGGNDIDRYITYRYLLPKFLETNGKRPTDFRTQERKHIACQLYKIAERLKILVNRDLAFMMSDFTVPLLKESDRPKVVEFPVCIETTRGELKQEKFELTPAQLTETMRVFTASSRIPKKIRGEDDYNNISIPIKSALEKSGVNNDEIDYVLFIGGSAKSPYIQEALRTMFSESELLVPRDLQTHVSKGAAIHSLLLNGMGKSIVQPITSEPIIAITKDAVPKTLFPAGSPIPCEIVTIDDLVTSRNNQSQIELPICLGAPHKLLHNLIIKPTSPMTGFPANIPVKVTLEVNADRLLIVTAECMGNICKVEPQNPFSNKELTTEERIVLEAERRANLDTLNNNGQPTKETLINLRKAYERVGNDFMAAEIYEHQVELYPNTRAYNAIGVLYANAGVKDKAIEFYERALEANPNDATAHLNLGLELKDSDNAQYREHIRKALAINPNHDVALIEAASIDEVDGKLDDANTKRQKAYDMMMSEWKNHILGDYGYGWLARVAEKLGHKVEAQQIRNSKPGLGRDKYYDEENLTRTRSTQIERF